MSISYFPKFWYEGNAYFKYVVTLEDLGELFQRYANNYDNPDIVLDRSMNDPNSSDTKFGLRSECNGETSLREYLSNYIILPERCGDMSIVEYIATIKKLNRDKIINVIIDG